MKNKHTIIYLRFFVILFFVVFYGCTGDFFKKESEEFKILKKHFTERGDGFFSRSAKLSVLVENNKEKTVIEFSGKEAIEYNLKWENREIIKYALPKYNLTKFYTVIFFIFYICALLVIFILWFKETR